MTWNITAYLVYGLITILIIYRVGKLCHSNGRVFILRLFHDNAQQADTTNNILLMAYYLFNIGYAVMQFSLWVRVSDASGLVESVAEKTGILVLILAVTHYFNIGLIYFLSKRHIHSITSKNIRS